ncbi:MAG TPA: TlpA disulfide reductase family protein [Anaerolineales bacterium]|nr:TlpA disulfide reductase family protein [Anaerolineales bacterium]
MSNRGSILAIMLGTALVGLALGLAFFRAPAEREAAPVDSSSTPGLGPGVGSSAPDFELTSLDGDRVRLSALQGRVVLLNFWATWCDPCRLEMPDLQTRADRFGDQLVVLGINFDEPEADVRAFQEELGLTFPLLLDPGAKVQQLYRVVGYPTSVFVDEDGIVRFTHVGIMSGDQIDRYLAELGVTG